MGEYMPVLDDTNTDGLEFGVCVAGTLVSKDHENPAADPGGAIYEDPAEALARAVEEKRRLVDEGFKDEPVQILVWEV